MKYKLLKSSMLPITKYINRIFMLSVSALIISVMAFTAFKLSSIKETKDKLQTYPASYMSIEASEVNASDSDSYTVKEYNGIIGIFKADSEKPFLTVDTPLCTIPEKDALLLEKGINIHGDEALQAIIEDFSG